jgi:hypothetical protein
MKERIVPPVLSSPYLARLRHRPLHGFPIARVSRVSLPYFRATTLFAEYVLMESSVAIWYRHKVPVAIAATGLWLVNASIFTYCKSPPTIPWGC